MVFVHMSDLVFVFRSEDLDRVNAGHVCGLNKSLGTRASLSMPTPQVGVCLERPIHVSVSRRDGVLQVVSSSNVWFRVANRM